MNLYMVETLIIKFNQEYIQELSLTLSFVRVRHEASFFKVGWGGGHLTDPKINMQYISPNFKILINRGEECVCIVPITSITKGILIFSSTKLTYLIKCKGG